jgi:hypothetical protein
VVKDSKTVSKQFTAPAILNAEQYMIAEKRIFHGI